MKTKKKASSASAPVPVPLRDRRAPPWLRSRAREIERVRELEENEEHEGLGYKLYSGRVKALETSLQSQRRSPIQLGPFTILGPYAIWASLHFFQFDMSPFNNYVFDLVIQEHLLLDSAHL